MYWVRPLEIQDGSLNKELTMVWVATIWYETGANNGSVRSNLVETGKDMEETIETSKK